MHAPSKTTTRRCQGAQARTHALELVVEVCEALYETIELVKEAVDVLLRPGERTGERVSWPSVPRALPDRSTH